jgi:hypothetical protein
MIILRILYDNFIHTHKKLFANDFYTVSGKTFADTAKASLWAENCPNFFFFFCLCQPEKLKFFQENIFARK